MKIKKNKRYKLILLFGCLFIVLGAAVVLNMIIKYNNSPYKKCEKIIKNICKEEGFPILFTDENIVRKQYLSSQEKLNSYKLNYELQDILFPETTGIISGIINSDSIGDFIKNVEIGENEEKEIYEVYEIKNISKEYIVAVKVNEGDKYIGITSMAYRPNDLKSLINDLQLENSYIEIEFNEDNQIVIYQNVDTEYIFNDFLAGDKKYIFRTMSYHRYHGLERESLNLWVTFYHKSINQTISLFVYEDGNIGIFLDNGIEYEFEADMEDTLKMLNYVVESYTGCIYLNRLR